MKGHAKQRQELEVAMEDGEEEVEVEVEVEVDLLTKLGKSWATQVPAERRQTLHPLNVSPGPHGCKVAGEAGVPREDPCPLPALRWRKLPPRPRGLLGGEKMPWRVGG